MKLVRLALVLASLATVACSFGNVTKLVFDHTSGIVGATSSFATGKFTLSAGAPVGGVDVTFAKNNPTDPIDLDVISVHLNQGEKTGSFTIHAPTLVSSTVVCTVTASDGSAVSAQGSISVVPMHVKAMNLKATAVRGCTVPVEVLLLAPNDTAGYQVNLSGSTGMSFVEGSSITFPAAMTTTVHLKIGTDAAPDGTNTLSALFVPTGVSFTRTPFKTIAMMVSTITADSTTLSSGQSTTVHVTVNGNVTSDTVVTVTVGTLLTASNAVIHAGHNSVDIPVTAKSTMSVKTQSLRVTLPDGLGKPLAFTINP